MNQFRLAKLRDEVSIGESVRIVRELQGFSQNKLSRLSGIPQATLSAIENDRVRLGVDRAKFWPAHFVSILPFWFSQGGNCRLKLRPNSSRRIGAVLSQPTAS
jgi:transcriptional regulator with XRE-family HTH domain